MKGITRGMNMRLDCIWHSSLEALSQLTNVKPRSWLYVINLFIRFWLGGHDKSDRINHYRGQGRFSPKIERERVEAYGKKKMKKRYMGQSLTSHLGCDWVGVSPLSLYIVEEKKTKLKIRIKQESFFNLDTYPSDQPVKKKLKVQVQLAKGSTSSTVRQSIELIDILHG